MKGQSLRPLLTGKGEFAERHLFWEHEGNAAIRIGDQKLVRSGLRGEWELFDLSADRTEQNNLAGQHADTVAEFAKQWQAWAKRANVLPKPGSRDKPAKKKRAKKGKAKKKQPAK